MNIAGRDPRRRVLVVAEIGNNHEGDAGLAAELVRLAAHAGADAVKFQTFDPDHFVARADAERHARLQRFRLKDADVEGLSGLARSLGLLFVSTPLDLRSAAMLEPLVDAYKIASGDNTFYPLLADVAARPKPMLVSAGLLDAGDIARTLDFVRCHRPAGLADVAILHCVTAYPAAPADANLRVIPALTATLPVVVGYSDHCEGVDAAAAAVALGARIVEKHFTIDHAHSAFRDHALSADPAQMQELVRRIRAVEPMLGDGIKRPRPAEQDNAVTVRRSIVAAADLPAGHVLRAADLTWVRPGGGLPPGAEERVVGKALRHAVRFGDLVAAADVIDRVSDDVCRPRRTDGT